jgi:hypothetical protein
MGYKKGIYRTKCQLGDAKIDIVVYDGENWWIPGWEYPLTIGKDLHFSIREDDIKELLYEWKDYKKN